MKNDEYWIWLQQALGEGTMIKEIIAEFGSAKNLYDSNIIEWKMSSALTPKQVNKLSETKISVAQEIIYSCQQNNWQIISYEDENYPRRLKEISNPPAVIYVSGEMPNIDSSVVIAIVGTRKASGYAIKVTSLMSKGISDCGAIVVSGGALGVDTAAHKGALMSGGKTIAVLGCGLGTNYLSSNQNLRNIIKENGCLLTEYPPFTPASRYTFPLRNRIISGLSLGVLVVEAGLKSGSLITANYALEQNRDVFAVPGSILSLDYTGTNKLINDGAMVVTEPVHIIEGYAEQFESIDVSKAKKVSELIAEQMDNSANIPKIREDSFEKQDETREKQFEKEKNEAKLKGDLLTVFSAVPNSFTHIDTIIQNSGLSSAKVLSAITQLEILDLVKSTSGKRYKLS